MTGGKQRLGQTSVAAPDGIDDGLAVGVAHGELGVAEFLDGGLRGGEGVAVFLAVELNPVTLELHPGTGMTAALQERGIGDGQAQELEPFRSFGQGSEAFAHAG